MTITDERKQVIDFSDPYFDATQALLVKKGVGHHDLARALNGKKLGAQNGTTGQEYANENAPDGVELGQFEDLGLLLTAVKTGQVDAGINDNGVLYDYVKKNPDFEVIKEFDTGEQYGIGVAEGTTPSCSTRSTRCSPKPRRRRVRHDLREVVRQEAGLPAELEAARPPGPLRSSPTPRSRCMAMSQRKRARVIRGVQYGRPGRGRASWRSRRLGEDPQRVLRPRGRRRRCSRTSSRRPEEHASSTPRSASRSGWCSAWCSR